VNRAFVLVLALIGVACGGGSDQAVCEQCSAPVVAAADAAADGAIESSASDAVSPVVPVDAAEAAAPVVPVDAAAEASHDAAVPDAAPADAGLPPACTGTVPGLLAQQLVADGALLVDVRTAAEYDAGHIAGAINVPVDEVASRLSEFPTDGPIVVYCHSGARAAQAMATLCAAGRTVYSLGAMTNWPS
jgi:rhodanese-related sulfurtransferase